MWQQVTDAALLKERGHYVTNEEFWQRWEKAKD
jgi:hypothetical protein